MSLLLSIKKCFHRKNVPILIDHHVTGRCLQRVQHVKDLGVTLDNGLTLRVHYDDVIAKANRQLGFIFKIANEYLKSLYCSLVKSILETNVVIWCPNHANKIARKRTRTEKSESVRTACEQRNNGCDTGRGMKRRFRSVYNSRLIYFICFV